MTRSRLSILAVDGGGIRGIIPARILQELEARMGRPAAELFDLVAGTSTGGIIALGLAAPGPGGRPAFGAGDLLELYREHGRDIFPQSLLGRVRSLAGMAGPRYPVAPLEGLLRERFGATMLSEALTEVVVPGYDLSGPSPFFFKRRYAQDAAHAWDVPMWLVARATSAAPTYFEPAELPAFEGEGAHALVDGGVFANNPAAAAYADALELAAGPETEIHVVSIGTGRPRDAARDTGTIPVSYAHALSWGLARWARPMLDVVFDGVAKTVEYQMTRLCRHADEEGGAPRYHRLQSELPTASHAMDDASPRNVERLLADADALLASPDGEAGLAAVCTALEHVAEDRAGARRPAPVG
jgi:predicted acylesterase/phospholipase RssA